MCNLQSSVKTLAPKRVRYCGKRYTVVASRADSVLVRRRWPLQWDTWIDSAGRIVGQEARRA